MNSANYLANVRFLPFQPYEQLNEFLNLADLHVLTQMEGPADLVLPSKLGGMLGSGKRVLITTDSDTELADFVGENVIISPPGDPEALAAAVLAARAQKVDPFEHQRLALAKTLSKKESLNLLCEHIGLACNAATSIGSASAFDHGLGKIRVRDRQAHGLKQRILRHRSSNQSMNTLEGHESDGQRWGFGSRADRP